MVLVVYLMKLCVQCTVSNDFTVMNIKMLYIYIYIYIYEKRREDIAALIL